MFGIIQDEIDRFEVELAATLRSDVAFIDAIGEDLVRSGGKRLRPTLAFLTGRILGSGPEEPMLAALAVELLHSASLLHDDLIDDADTRRGAEAAFRRYGNVVSVMSGDFMLARVLGLLARSGDLGFIELMSRTAAAICEAEVLQFQTASLQDRSMAGYWRIIDGKTAALMVAATEGVAVLAGAELAERAALREFATAYGRAFQIRDDYLDLLGDAGLLGKPVGSDLREGKATYPVLLLLFEQKLDEVHSILERHAGRPGDVDRVIALALEHGADERTRQRIAAEARRAVTALSRFPPSPALEALRSLPERELERVS